MVSILHRNVVARLQGIFKDIGSKTFSSHSHRIYMDATTEPGISAHTNYNYQETINIPIAHHQELSLHPIWLRHHCRCAECINYSTHQRSLIPAQLPQLSHIGNIRIEQDQLHILWSDSHETTFDLNWLKTNTGVRKPSNEYHRFRMTDVGKKRLKDIILGPKDPLENSVDYLEFMQDGDAGVTKLLENIVIYGYGTIKNAPADFDLTKAVVKKISHPQNTIFGDFSEWTSDLAHADTAYTSEYVYLHTDTTYFSEPMGLQMFHCLSHVGSGGINSIVDGFNIAKTIHETNQEHYRILSEYPVPYHYTDPGRHCFSSHDVIFGHDIATGALNRIRYNPHDFAVINSVPAEELGNFYAALVDLSMKIENDPNWIKLSPGIIIFLDNWRTLHGRTSFKGRRHLCGAYIGRSDWISRARVLKILK